MIQSCKLNTAFGIAEINTNIVESNPPSELLTSAAVGNLFTQCQRVVRKPIRYVTIHFQDRSGAASLRCKNRAEISDPFVNRSPIRYSYCVGAQAIRYSVDIALNSLKFEISRCHLADTSRNCTKVRAARAARFLVQIADAVCLTTR